MSSWVIPSSKDRPENVGIGFDHGQWGMRRNRAIARGDLIYFWQSGASFVALGMATTDVFAAEPDDAPWDDGVEYTHRFGLELVSDAPTSAPTWTQVASDLGVGGSIQGPRSFDGSAQEEALLSYFAQQAVPAGGRLQPDPLMMSPYPLDVPRMLAGHPQMETVLRAMRQGREAFIRTLKAAYGGRCAVTGTGTEGVLDAAHIVRYRGPLTNDVRNGLLLRADIHRLFDKGLIHVRPSGQSPTAYVVHLDPALAHDPTYGGLDGRPLLLKVPGAGPDAAALEQHRAEVARRPAGEALDAQ